MAQNVVYPGQYSMFTQKECIPLLSIRSNWLVWLFQVIYALIGFFVYLSYQLLRKEYWNP